MALSAAQKFRMTPDEVAGLLEPSLGMERSKEVVSNAVVALQLPEDSLTIDQVDTLLGQLSRLPEMVGVSARFARQRLKTSRSQWVSAEGVTGDTGLASNEPDSGLHRVGVSRAELVDLLAGTLGREKGEELIRVAGELLGASGSVYEKDLAFAILDRLSRSQGLVGITARFAKARLILKVGE